MAVQMKASEIDGRDGRKVISGRPGRQALHKSRRVIRRSGEKKSRLEENLVEFELGRQMSRQM